MKKYVAEFFGTLVLTLVVSASILSGAGLPTYLLAGIIVGLFVWTIGHVSGTHLNPAVTLALFTFKRIGKRDTVGYIVAQFAGAVGAMLLVSLLNFKLPQMATDYALFPLLAETLGMTIFAFGIASVALGGRHDHAAFTIGGSLAIGAMVAGSLGANGIVNPAVALGINSFGVAYLVGPILGALLGMWVYKKVSE
ncbi:MAG TPA: aquaporin [Candidatus Paceibacterota bacterium]|nr:aquaporin [Candidatus Paceibacterota bacterium]